MTTPFQMRLQKTRSAAAVVRIQNSKQLKSCKQQVRPAYRHVDFLPGRPLKFWKGFTGSNAVLKKIKGKRDEQLHPQRQDILINAETRVVMGDVASLVRIAASQEDESSRDPGAEL